MTTSNWIIVAVVATLVVLGVALIARRRGASVADTSHRESPVVSSTAPAASAPVRTVAPAAVDVPPDALEKAVVEPPVVEAPVVEPHVVEAPVEVNRSLRSRLGKARGVFAAATAAVRGRGGVDDATWDDLEEAMLRADLGVRVVTELLEPLRAKAKKRDIADADAAIAALRSAMVERLAGADRTLHLEARSGAPDVWLMVGVNGAGKTTTLGKLAAQQTRAVVAYARGRPDIDPGRGLVMGQSYGGATAIAVAADPPEGVRAAVNFAGGGGGRPSTHPGQPCSPMAMERLFGGYGATARIPTLWLYAPNDRYMGERHPRAWFEAFLRAGGRGRFVALPEHGEDGHSSFTRNPGAWRPAFEAFLREAGLEPGR